MRNTPEIRRGQTITEGARPVPPGGAAPRGPAQREERAPEFDLVSVVSAARRAVAQGYVVDRTDPDKAYRDPGFSVPPASIAHVGLRTRIVNLIDGGGHVGRVPAAQPAHRTETLRDVVFEQSLAVQAGARLIEISQPEGIPGGPVPAFREVPTRFELIEPVNFAVQTLTETVDPNLATQAGVTNEESTVADTPFPRMVAELDRAALTRRAVRFRFSRRQWKDIGPERMSGIVMRSIAQGLARAVDAELFAAVIATGDGFPNDEAKMAETAAKGLRFDTLKAFIGTNGDGANIVQGKLYTTEGYPAELTPDVAETVLAAWDRFAVAVEPEISILVQRDSAGGLTFTVNTDMAALIPDPGFGWVMTAAA
jgi:hypothetical protein